jgi:hypothetical protein
MRGRPIYLPGLLLIWLLVLTLAMKSVLDHLAVLPWGNPMGEARSVELSAGSQIGQSFVAALPGLSAIEVTLDTTALATPQQLVLRLKEAPGTAATLAARTLELAPNVPATTARFELVPMPDSKGRTLDFVLEAPDALPGQGPAAYYSPAATTEGSSAYLNGRPIPGDLQFQTYYRLSAGQKVALLLDRLAQGRTGLLGAKGFYVGLGLAYAMFLLLFLWRIAHAVLGREASSA